MHQAVLNRDLQQQADRELLPGRGGYVGKLSLEAMVERTPGASDVVSDVREGWPVLGLIGGKSTTDRINPERKEAIVFRVQGVDRENAVSQQIPVERFQVTDVEDDAVSFRDGTFVKRILPDETEELVGAGASLRQSLQQFVTKLNFPLRCEHFPGLLSRERPTVRCPETGKGSGVSGIF